MNTSLGQTASLKVREYRGGEVLAVDTGYRADSIEGLRLVKASRGSGWLWRAGRLELWETRGVLQEEGRLLIWGETPLALGGLQPSAWCIEGADGWNLQTALARAWTALAQKGGLPAKFEPLGVMACRDGDGWAVAFLPRELAGVLTSILPREIRLTWEPCLHPDAGAHSWPFATACLLWRTLETSLPWDQEDESFLRQEIRELPKTLTASELPPGLDAATLALWTDSLTKPDADLAARWAQWAAETRTMPTVSPRTEGPARTRLQVRKRRAFWRRRGTPVLFAGAGVVAVLALAGSIVWGIVKPDPTDHWSPEQVVQGYYRAVSDLDTTQLKKLVQADRARYPDVTRDDDQTSNLFVLVQVRVGYEHKSPLIPADQWQKEGKAPLMLGQILFGVTDLKVIPGAGEASWTADYVKWSSNTPSAEGDTPQPVAEHDVDTLTLQKTWKGWKIVGLVRQRKALP